MKILISILLLIGIFSTSASCDELEKYVRINFIKELGIVHIKALTLVNASDSGILTEKGINKKNASVLAKKYGLYLGYYKCGPIILEDTIKSAKIKIQIMYDKPSGGQCGANPAANIKIWVNGKPIIKDVLFHQECFGRPSINEAIIYIDEPGPRLDLTVAKNDWETLLSVPFNSYGNNLEKPIDEELIEKEIKRYYPKLYKLNQN